METRPTAEAEDSWQAYLDRNGLDSNSGERRRLKRHRHDEKLDLVEVEDPPDPSEEPDVEVPSTERQRRDAASISHLLTHSPANPFCPTCQWAKKLRKQHQLI